MDVDLAGVLAVLALFVAVFAVSLAIVAFDLVREKSQRGPRGWPGPTGAQGPQGEPGPPGRCCGPAPSLDPVER